MKKIKLPKWFLTKKQETIILVPTSIISAATFSAVPSIEIILISFLFFGVSITRLSELYLFGVKNNDNKNH